MSKNFSFALIFLSVLIIGCELFFPPGVYQELGKRKHSSSSKSIIAVAASFNYTLAIKNDGSLWATGNNYYGQLGTGNNNTTNTFIKVSF